jgi:hypothetical protein
MLEDMSRIRYVDRQEDVILVEDSAEYVCLMKLFPMCWTRKVLPDEHYRRFHMRFYIPREYFNDAHRKIDRIIIMTNGLDEFKEYRLYDQLGSRLASLGLPAVLLPLPDHLNRHVRYRLREPGQDKITTRPFDEIFAKPMVLHERFLQYKSELAQLLNHINKKTRKRACDKPESPCSFYSHFFADVVRVSYLGFSLGGATMLCDFLDSQIRLNACFLLNPAIKLPEVKGKRLGFRDEEVWDDFVERLSTAYDEYKEPDRDKRFGEILLGHIISARRLLKEYRQKLLFIYGGADDFTHHENTKDITPRETGSGMFIIPGVKHNFEGEEWQKWSTLTVKLISDFEENAARHVIPKPALKRSRKKKNVPEISEEEFHKTEEWYRPSLLKIQQNMTARADEEKKVANHIEATSLEDLRLGEMLRKRQLILPDEFYDILAEQRCSDLKIGDIAADVFRLVSREQVNETLGKQRRPKDEA